MKKLKIFIPLLIPCLFSCSNEEIAESITNSSEAKNIEDLSTIRSINGETNTIYKLESVKDYVRDNSGSKWKDMDWSEYVGHGTAAPDEIAFYNGCFYSNMNILPSYGPTTFYMALSTLCKQTQRAWPHIFVKRDWDINNQKGYITSGRRTFRIAHSRQTKLF